MPVTIRPGSTGQGTPVEPYYIPTFDDDGFHWYIRSQSLQLDLFFGLGRQENTAGFDVTSNGQITVPLGAASAADYLAGFVNRDATVDIWGAPYYRAQQWEFVVGAGLSCAFPQSAAGTGWGKTAWLWTNTGTLIYPDGSRCRLQPGEPETLELGQVRADDGVLYLSASNPPGGGQLVFRQAVGDLVNITTGAAHNWPGAADCVVSFRVDAAADGRRPGVVSVQCAGPEPDPLCGRSYPAPGLVAVVGSVLPRGG